MRDPNRIPIILEKINKAWTMQPDLRLEQLILNAITLADRQHQHTYTDLWNFEDTQLEIGLNKIIEDFEFWEKMRAGK